MSQSARIPQEPRREPSFDSSRPTAPPLLRNPNPITEPRSRAGGRLNPALILAALALAAIVPVAGYFLSEYLSTFFNR